MQALLLNEVASRLVKNMPQSSKTPESYVTRPDTQFTIQNVSLTKVYKLLSTIKASKSAGHDRIPGKLLRDAAEVIAPSLTAIFNASINTGIFPEECIVMEKMHCYGIRGHTLAWFQSYLSSRIQICKVDQTMSKTRTVNWATSVLIIYKRPAKLPDLIFSKHVCR
jgi:hypothetical protein